VSDNSRKPLAKGGKCVLETRTKRDNLTGNTDGTRTGLTKEISFFEGQEGLIGGGRGVGGKAKAMVGERLGGEGGRLRLGWYGEGGRRTGGYRESAMIGGGHGLLKGWKTSRLIPWKYQNPRHSLYPV